MRPIRELVKNPEHRLELVEADCNDKLSWKAAVVDCDYVIHTARSEVNTLRNVYYIVLYIVSYIMLYSVIYCHIVSYIMLYSVIYPVNNCVKKNLDENVFFHKKMCKMYVFLREFGYS